MKKLLIISISIMIVLALSSGLMAKAVEFELTPVANTETGTVKVILNNPAGSINLVVQVNLKDGQEDGFIYTVWIEARNAEDNDWVVLSDHPWLGNDLTAEWYKLGELVTNKVGNGTFHTNLELDYSGKLTGIVVALDRDYDQAIQYWNMDEKEEIEIK